MLETELGKGRLRAIRALQTRRGRERSGQTIIEGVRLVEAALAAGVELGAVLYSERLLRSPRGERLVRRSQEAGGQVCLVDEATLSSAAATETPQGILAVIPAPGVPAERLLAQERPFLLAVDGVQDPGNLGTMLRTAAAAGATGVLLGRGTVEFANPKVLRAAMGAAFLLPIAEGAELPDALSALAARGVAVVAGDPQGREDLFSSGVAVPAVVVVGGEANGLSTPVEGAVTRRVRIPMAPGVESLNAGVAAALLLYEVARRSALPVALPADETL
jgi:TrmH family RNA methyltransferase